MKKNSRGYKVKCWEKEHWQGWRHVEWHGNESTWKERSVRGLNFALDWINRDIMGLTPLGLKFLSKYWQRPQVTSVVQWGQLFVSSFSSGFMTFRKSFKTTVTMMDGSGREPSHPVVWGDSIYLRKLTSYGIRPCLFSSM